jgi:UDP-glucose 4-epimerase
MIEGAGALVTGGAGFIGSALVDGLVEAGAARIVVVDDLSLGRRSNLEDALESGRVELVEADCADLELLRGLAREPFDLCFNLAVIPLPHSLEHPRENVDRNVAMTTAVCELGRAGGYGRLVQYSSSEVYGTAQSAAIAEDHPLHPHTPYAAAKAATDLIAASYATTFGLPVVTVRPFNTYGERQNDAAYAGLIPAVVRRVQAGQPVLVHGDGEQTRDMVYVADSVAGTLSAAASDEALGTTINLGSGQEASVNEMVRLILAAMDRPDHPVEHGPERPGDVRRLLADVKLARELVGFQPRTSLEDGLRRTVSWYLQGSP